MIEQSFGGNWLDKQIKTAYASVAQWQRNWLLPSGLEVRVLPVAPRFLRKPFLRLKKRTLSYPRSSVERASAREAESRAFESHRGYRDK